METMSGSPSKTCASVFRFSLTSFASFSNAGAQGSRGGRMRPARGVRFSLVVAALAAACAEGVAHDARSTDVVEAVRAAYLLERRVLDAQPKLHSRAAV